MMRAPVLIALGIGSALGLWACSFTTAGNFTECTTDMDCDSASACSQRYCLPLPTGCRREEAGGVVNAFEKANRIPLVALLAIGADGERDDSEVQSANAIKLALSEGNDRLSDERGYFGLFLCNTKATGANLQAQGEWFIDNLQVPAMFVTNSVETQTIAQSARRKAAGTLVVSPNSTSPDLIGRFVNDGNVWRLAPPDTFQAEVVTDLLATRFDAGTSVAVLAPVNAYGEGFGNPLKETLTARGFAASLFQYSVDDALMPLRENAVQGAHNATAKATVIIGNPRNAAFLIEKAQNIPGSALTRDAGHSWYLTDSAKEVSVLTDGTRRELQGALGTAPAQGNGLGYPTFRDVFRARYRVDPSATNYVSHSYDAAWLVMLATQFALGETPDLKRVTGPKLAEGFVLLASSTGPATQLRADKWVDLSSSMIAGVPTNVEGASGPLNFDVDAGFAPSKYEIWRVVDGGIVVDRLVDP